MRNINPSPASVIEKPEILVGIDCGVNTGFAVWNCRTKSFTCLATIMIHEAFALVLQLHQERRIKVRVEDARQVRYKTSAAKAKGAGSVCRDAKAWEDFLTDHEIPFEMVRPNKQITDWTAEQFELRTGCKARTSTHARDAALLVYGL